MFLHPQKGDVILVRGHEKPLLVIEDTSTLMGLKQCCTTEGYVTVDAVDKILSIAKF